MEKGINLRELLAYSFELWSGSRRARWVSLAPYPASKGYRDIRNDPARGSSEVGTRPALGPVFGLSPMARRRQLSPVPSVGKSRSAIFRCVFRVLRRIIIVYRCPACCPDGLTV